MFDASQRALMFTRARSLPLFRSTLLGPLAVAVSSPLLVSAQVPPDAPLPWAGTELAQLTIHERLIIRIPRVSPSRARATPIPPAWREKKGPRCVEMKSLTGAAISDDGDVDLIVEGVRRLRAKLDEGCPVLNFYTGFYLKPTADGKICARRDTLRSRSGTRCGIDRFRKLVAAG